MVKWRPESNCIRKVQKNPKVLEDESNVTVPLLAKGWQRLLFSHVVKLPQRAPPLLPFPMTSSLVCDNLVQTFVMPHHTHSASHSTPSLHHTTLFTLHSNTKPHHSSPSHTTSVHDQTSVASRMGATS